MSSLSRQETESPFDEFTNDAPVLKRRKTSKWPVEVEDAFEEAASLIPKQSIKNIAICGSKHGRSRYILFYIYYKTGYIRNIGQITSHIQAITKNKSDEHLLDLMLNGPGESEEVCTRFVQKFTTIIKSLPPKLLLGDIKGLENKMKFENERKMNTLNASKSESQPIKFSVKKFEMVYINFKLIDNSHMFSTLASQTVSHSSIKEVSITKEIFNSKYPETFEVIEKLRRITNESSNHALLHKNEKTTRNIIGDIRIPIIHAKALMFLPPITKDLTSGYYNFSIKTAFSDLPREENKYGVLTLVIAKKIKIQESFEILESSLSKNKKNEVITNIKIGTNYWKNYLSTKRRELSYNGPDLLKLQEKSIELEIQPLKIQQFIVYCGENDYSSEKDVNISNIKSSDFRGVIIWRFGKVNDQAQAVTSFTKIGSIIESERNDAISNPTVQESTVESTNSNSETTLEGNSTNINDTSLLSSAEHLGYNMILTPPTIKRSSVPHDHYTSNYGNNYYITDNSYQRNSSMPSLRSTNDINNDISLFDFGVGGQSANIENENNFERIHTSDAFSQIETIIPNGNYNINRQMKNTYTPPITLNGIIEPTEYDVVENNKNLINSLKEEVDRAIPAHTDINDRFFSNEFSPLDFVQPLNSDDNYLNGKSWYGYGKTM